MKNLKYTLFAIILFTNFDNKIRTANFLFLIFWNKHIKSICLHFIFFLLFYILSLTKIENVIDIYT